MDNSIREVNASLEKFERNGKMDYRDDYWITIRDYPILRFPSLDAAKDYIGMLIDSIIEGSLHCDASELGIVNVSVKSVNID